jgi:hypothetical protein
MPFSVEYKGIVFVEGTIPVVDKGPAVECDLSFALGAQLKSLRDVKDEMAGVALGKGYNAILDFTYGQKSRWLAIDDVAFYGKGVLATISKEDYDRIASAKS